MITRNIGPAFLLNFRRKGNQPPRPCFDKAGMMVMTASTDVSLFTKRRNQHELAC
jgi:hypothetical protein